MSHDFAAGSLQHAGAAHFPQDTWRNYDDGMSRAQLYGSPSDDEAARSMSASSAAQVDADRALTRKLTIVGIGLVAVIVGGLTLDALVRAHKRSAREAERGA